MCWSACSRALREQRVALEGMLLKPNMVVPGKDAPERASVPAVATATVRVLLRQRAGGGAGRRLPLRRTERARGDRAPQRDSRGSPRRCRGRVSFSFGRALQDPALAAWRGRADRVPAAQRALHQRLRCNSAASRGAYDESMEQEAAAAEMTLH